MKTVDTAELPGRLGMGLPKCWVNNQALLEIQVKQENMYVFLHPVPVSSVV